MQILRTHAALLCAALLLTGFNWGFNNETCREAMELVGKLDTLRDETQQRLTEAKILSICPDGGAGHYIIALQFERIGNVDGAIGEYRKALQQEPLFPLASGNLGLLYAQKGLNDEASVELARGLSSVPNPNYHRVMGRILAERKVFPLAIYHYNEAARGLSRDPGIFIALAEIYVATGQPDKALEEYQRALTADPNNEKGHIGIATIHLGRNDPVKALESLKKAEMANPQNREVHLMKAGIYEKKGDAKLAEYEYLLGGKSKPLAPITVTSQPPVGVSNVSGDTEKDIETLKGSLKEYPAQVDNFEKLGNLYRTAGKDTEAIAAYREAAHLNSANSDVYLNMGILYEKRGLPDEAAVAYRRAIQAKPDNANARLRLADIYLARGSQSQAVEQYSEFLKLKPDSPDIQLNLARLFARNKETNLALESYLLVLKHSPENTDANREIGILYKSKGQDDKAVQYYKKVLAQQKDDMDTRNSLVSIYVKNKQYGEIANLLKETVELFPDDPDNYYKLGLIYDFKKDYENAIASYKKAVELKPDHTRSLNALGRLYMKTGRLSEAKEILETAKKSDPNQEESSVLLSNIRDDFNPEPRKIIKRKKSKSKKGAKSSKSRSKNKVKTKKKP